jgi:hypothetical protein
VCRREKKMPFKNSFARATCKRRQRYFRYGWNPHDRYVDAELLKWRAVAGCGWCATARGQFPFRFAVLGSYACVRAVYLIKKRGSSGMLISHVPYSSIFGWSKSSGGCPRRTRYRHVVGCVHCALRCGVPRGFDSSVVNADDGRRRMEDSLPFPAATTHTATTQPEHRVIE